MLHDYLFYLWLGSVWADWLLLGLLQSSLPHSNSNLLYRVIFVLDFVFQFRLHVIMLA